MPKFSLIDENSEVAQEVATFPICGLRRNSILTNAPTVRAVETDNLPSARSKTIETCDNAAVTNWHACAHLNNS